MNNTYSIIVERNCEYLCIKELKERFNLKGIPNKGYVDFTASNEIALRVAYFSQSAKRIILKIGQGTFEDLEDLTEKLDENLNKNPVWQTLVTDTYRSSCSRTGAHDFNSVIVEQETSNIIKKTLSSKNLESTANYNSKELIFYVNIEDENYLFGIDYAGKDLSKRHYMFFNNPIAVKGTIAFNLLLFSDYKPGATLLDCFALAGVIPIETAIYERNMSAHLFSKDFFFPKKIKETNDNLLKKFDVEVKEEKLNNVFSCDSSFPNLSAQKKNSRIAGVEKNISFSRTDIRNLDIKNFSKEIDLVCSRIIEPSKKISEGLVIRTYEDFFLAAKEFLAKKGTINLIVRSFSLLQEIAQRYDFEVVDKLETAQGQQELFFVKFKRKT